MDFQVNPNEVYSGQSKWSVLTPIQMKCIQANNGKFTVIMGATICMERFTKNIKILYETWPVLLELLANVGQEVCHSLDLGTGLTDHA